MTLYVGIMAYFESWVFRYETVTRNIKNPTILSTH